MGFSESKFLSLPPEARAKKLAGLLRILLLRLGQDWKHAQAEYEKLVAWHAPQQADLLLGKSMQHARVMDLYHHWRTLAGLGPERDMYLQQDPGDLEQPQVPALPWSILAHNLRSAYNVGSLIRTVDCFGLHGVHLSGYTPDVAHASLRSAARGAESWVPVQRWDSPRECIQHFKSQGYAILALETGADAVPLPTFPWPKQGLVLLGNEELGIAPELLAECTHKVAIPMRGRKASLNVASAFAVAAAFLDRNLRAGNAMALALLVLVIATVLATAIITGSGSTSQQAARSLYRIQAQYLAESAIRLEGSRFPWNPADSLDIAGPLLSTFPALPPVNIDTSGLWIRIDATGVHRETVQQIEAFFGVALSAEAFAPAIRLLASQAPTDQASLRVEGDVLIANKGGAISAAKIMEQASTLTQRLWFQRRNQMGLAFHADSLPHCRDLCVRGTQSISRESDFPELQEMRVIEGDLRIDLGFTGTPSHIAGRRRFLVQGAVLVRGNIQFDTLEIIASGNVTLEGDIYASHVEIASEQRLFVSGEPRFEAILLAEGDLEIRGKAKLGGTSWIAATRQAPDPEAGAGHIEILDGAHIEGWVCALTPNTSNLHIDHDSRISGIAIATGGIQNEGEIFGSAIAAKLNCAGHQNENCGGSGEFIRDSLPAGFMQPPAFQFGQPRKLGVLRWRLL